MIEPAREYGATVVASTTLQFWTFSSLIFAMNGVRWTSVSLAPPPLLFFSDLPRPPRSPRCGRGVRQLNDHWRAPEVFSCLAGKRDTVTPRHCSVLSSLESPLTLLANERNIRKTPSIHRVPLPNTYPRSPGGGRAHRFGACYRSTARSPTL